MFGSVKKVQLSLLVGVVGILLAGSASAASNPTSCLNDIDCIATPQCGGDVCPYDGPHPFTCQPAGAGAKGHDGWCTSDTDCKCMAQGARCIGGAYCSFTKASDAPASGAGGSTGSAGSTGSPGSAGSAGPARRRRKTRPAGPGRPRGGG